MLKRLVLLLPLLLILPAPGLAQDAQTIKNPEAVSYLHAEVSREGSVYLFDNSPFQSARELRVTLTVPQNTSNQASYVKSVTGPDRFYADHDEWGNTVIKLYWEMPELKKKLTYSLVTDVEVFGGQEGAKNPDFPATPLTAETQEIAKTAYDVSYGLDDLQKIFRLTEWVHENVRYDNDVKSFSESAKWTYQNGRGACDEFSNLLMSMLRTVGYSPRYVVGYAYSEGWGQHGWVEVNYNGKTLSLDPTWLESPADATHIKIAELPDSNLSEHVEVTGGQITIDWNKGEPEVRVISHKEEPRLDVETNLVPQNSTGGSYSLLETTFRNPGCVLTQIQAKSCIMSSGPFLYLPKTSQTLAFCGLQKSYWFIRSPETDRNMVYICPVMIYGGGAEKSITVSVAADSRKKLSTRVSSQDVFTPGEDFQVTTVTENSGRTTENITVFVFFEGSVQSRDFLLGPRGSSSIKWTLKAPAAPGIHELSVFSSSGELASRNITVVSQRHAQIANISAPEKAVAKESFSMNISVKALTAFSGTVKTKIEDYTDTRKIALEANKSESLEIAYIPESPGTKTISVMLLSDSGQYEDGWWGSVQVDSEAQWYDAIVGWLQDLWNAIAGALGWG